MHSTGIGPRTGHNTEEGFGSFASTPCDPRLGAIFLLLLLLLLLLPLLLFRSFHLSLQGMGLLSADLLDGPLSYPALLLFLLLLTCHRRDDPTWDTVLLTTRANETIGLRVGPGLLDYRFLMEDF